MALAVANRSGGKTSERGLYDFIGSSTTGSVVSGFTVRENSPLGMSVRIGGVAGTRDTLLIRDGLNTQVVFTDDGQPVTASVSPAHASLYRVDRVVVYIDKSVARSTTVLDNNNGVVKAVVVAGNPDSQANAVAPTDAMIQSAIGSTNRWVVLGDLSVAPGVTQVTLSAVTDRRVMAAITTPAAKSPKIGVIPASTFNSTGNKSITGVGFKPSLVKFTLLYPLGTGITSSATGFMDQSGNQYHTYMTASSRGSGSNACFVSVSNGTTTATLLAKYVSMDSDGFTLNVSTNSVTVDVLYEAYP